MTRSLTFAAALIAVAAPAFADGDAAKGEKEFRKCKSCHSIASASEDIVKGGKTGPNLYGVIGRTAGTAEGFKYGDDIKKLGETGFTWEEDALAEYVQDPKRFLQDHLDDKTAKSKMTFKLAKGGEDIAAYLATFSD